MAHRQQTTEAQSLYKYYLANRKDASVAELGALMADFGMIESEVQSLILHTGEVDDANGIDDKLFELAYTAMFKQRCNGSFVHSSGESISSIGTKAPPRPLLKQRMSSQNVLTLLPEEQMRILNEKLNKEKGAPPAARCMPLLKQRQSSKNVFELLSPTAVTYLSQVADGAKPKPKPMMLQRQQSSSAQMLNSVSAMERSKLEALANATGSHAGHQAPAAGALGMPARKNKGPPPLLKNRQSSRNVMETVTPGDKARLAALAELQVRDEQKLKSQNKQRPFLKQRQSSQALLSLVSPAAVERLEQVAVDTAAELSGGGKAPEPAADAQFVKRKVRQTTEEVNSLEKSFFGAAPTNPAVAGGGGMVQATDVLGETGSPLPSRRLLKQRMSSRALLDVHPEIRKRLSAVALETAPNPDALSDGAADAEREEAAAAAPVPEVVKAEPEFAKRKVRQMTEEVSSLESTFFVGTGSVDNDDGDAGALSPTASQMPPMSPQAAPQFAKRALRQKTADVSDLEAGFFGGLGSGGDSDAKNGADDVMKTAGGTIVPGGGILAEMMQLAQQLDDAGKTGSKNDDMLTPRGGEGDGPPKGTDSANGQFAKRSLRQKTADVSALEDGFFSVYKKEPEMGADAEAEAKAAAGPTFAKRKLRQKTEEVSQLEEGFFGGLGEDSPVAKGDDGDSNAGGDDGGVATAAAAASTGLNLALISGMGAITEEDEDAASSASRSAMSSMRGDETTGEMDHAALQNALDSLPSSQKSPGNSA